MKKLFSLLILLLICSYSFAQINNSTAEFQKLKQPALVIEVPFPEDVVTSALMDSLERAGYKGKDTKGYYTYKSVKIPDGGSHLYDFYFKTEPKSKKEKGITIVTMLISGGFEKFLSDSDSTIAVMNQSRSFLSKLTNVTIAYDLEQQIKEQDALTAKAEKKLNNYIDEGQSLQKKKQKLEDEIKENSKNQDDQKAEAEKQRKILDTLKEKRVK